MDDSVDQQHWNKVYSSKAETDVSWYETYPHRSVSTIESFSLSKMARIIDVGGGESRLVDALLTLGYQNLTVLDISVEALARAQQRLGNRARRVRWVISDVTTFQPEEPFHIWHDRATFHFLTHEPQINAYLANAEQSVIPGGFLTVGTFSDRGPSQCSGLTVRQYSPITLASQFANRFTKLHCEEADHQTPTGSVQTFTFCQFQRNELP